MQRAWSHSSECRNKRVLFINGHGEWESESEHEDSGAPDEHEDEESEKSGCDIQADMGDCFVSRRVLSVNATREEKGSAIIFCTPVAPSRRRFAELLLTMEAATTLQVQI